MMKKDAKDIVKELTLEEKASLCSGYDGWNTKSLPSHGIPAIRTCDGPSGLRYQTEEDDYVGVYASKEMVSYPTGCAMASTFDPDLVREVGKAIGEEAGSVGVGLVLGPAMNIKRTPLCGRNFEYYSEDPYLTGEIAAAEVDGIQSEGVGACLKHFACNNQETERMRINSVVDERTLNEIYLAAFKRAVQEQPCAVMASYNRINGFPATQNRDLLTEKLRKEWGFRGIVVTDWGASNDRIEGLKAGTDLEMPGSSGITDRQIVRAVREGKLDESTVDAAAERVTEASLAFGGREPGKDFDHEAHHRIAVRCEEEGAVLLKNDGILPLSRGERVAFIGEFARKPRIQGGGSASVTPFKVTNALEEARKLGEDIVYARGFSTSGDGSDDTQLLEEAVKAAASCRRAIVFLGLPDTWESESYDRPDMNLPENQIILLEEVLKVQPGVAVVLNSGSPVAMPWVSKVRAILQMHTGGQGIGEATVNLLYGIANPCGKLAETYPARLEDTPAYLSYPGDGRDVVYNEGIFVGYRYYDRKKLPVLFPFGHGLSYTTFVYRNLQTVYAGNGTWTVTADITNTGSRAGKEAVQLYIGDRTGERTSGNENFHVDEKANVYIRDTGDHPIKCEKELKGICKILLQPSETKQVCFRLDASSFSWYDPSVHGWVLDEGTYEIMLGSSSRDIRLSECIELNEKTVPGLCRRHRIGTLTMDSLVSEYSQIPELWETTLQYLAAVSPELEKIIHGTDSNSMYLTEELKELPFYAIRGIYSVEQEKLEELIHQLNQIIAERGY